MGQKGPKVSDRSQNRTPRISCIIIFLNGEKYIAEAIESVLAQSFTDWELILVDDGSTDGATAIAREYVRRHPERIIYTEHPGHENRGMSASRNAGLRLARGSYIAFLDADDVWLPERLAVHHGVLESRPEAVMSISPTMLWSSWNKDNLPRSRPWIAADLVEGLGLPVGKVLTPPTVATHYLASHGAGLPGICSLLIRREELLAVGGFEDSFRRLYEDQVMLFKIFLNHPVIVIDQVLDYYRQHPKSACSSDRAHAELSDIGVRPIFLEWLQTYMVERGITDPDTWRALRGEMLRFDNPQFWRLANLPHALLERWNVESRRALIWLLTPARYQVLRRRFGMKPVDLGQG
jgi:glycosyltransferase involved in cell wall biosynthesis